MADLPTPKFSYGAGQHLTMSLPATPYVRGLMANAGGEIEGDSGLKTGYVVSDSELLMFSIRFFETEWPDVVAFIDTVMDGQEFTFFPVSADAGESYTVTLESPAVATSYSAVPDPQYPRVLTLAIVLRSPSGSSGFDQPSLQIREYQDEFETPTFSVDGASTARRPDAISFDYLRAAAPGPNALADLSLGPVARKWKVRCVGDTVYAARSNDTNTDWEAEFILFTFANAIADPIIELDFAFTQAGTAVVWTERPSGLWLYWFDPLVPGNVFVNLGPGRTPRCLLDQDDSRDPLSDVLLFYINNDAASGDGAICYRVQRERYATEHETPIIGGGELAVPALGEVGPITGPGTYGAADSAITVTVPDGIIGGGDPIIPPVPHSPPRTNTDYPVPTPWYGDFQISSAKPYGSGEWGVTVFEFDRPITSFRIRPHYPVSSPSGYAFAYAVLNREDINDYGFATTHVAQNVWIYDPEKIDDDEAVLTYAPGFRFVVLQALARNLATGAPIAGPTFSHFYVSATDAAQTLPPIEAMFVEDAVKTSDNRTMVVYATHDSETGRYTIQTLSSSLYPLFSDSELFAVGGMTMGEDGILVIALFIIEPPGTSATQYPNVYSMPDESLLQALNMTMEDGGTLIDNTELVLPEGSTVPPAVPVGRYAFHSIDDLLGVLNMTFQSGTILSNVYVVIPNGTSPPPNVLGTFFDFPGDAGRNADLFNMTLEAGGTLVTIVIVYVASTTFDLDGTDLFNMTLQSGTLGP